MLIFRPARPFSVRVLHEVHQGILYGSFFGFSTPNRSDKNCLSQCQSYFQDIGLLLLYRCSRCQTRLDSAGNKSVLSMPLCYLSISVFSWLSICLLGMCYTACLRYRPVSNRLPLSWRPCNHVKWKRSGRTENNRCPTTALYRGCLVKHLLVKERVIATVVLVNIEVVVKEPF